MWKWRNCPRYNLFSAKAFSRRLLQSFDEASVFLADGFAAGLSFYMSACLNFTLYCENSFPSNWWRNDVRELSRICQEFAGGDYSIEIVHLREERRRAMNDGVVTTPSVLLERKDGRKQNLG